MNTDRIKKWLDENAVPGEYALLRGLKGYRGPAVAYHADDSSPQTPRSGEGEDCHFHYNETIVAFDNQMSTKFIYLSQFPDLKFLELYTVRKLTYWRDLVGTTITPADCKSSARLVCEHLDDKIFLVDTAKGHVTNSYSADATVPDVWLIRL